MNPRLVGRVLFPIHERLKGKPTFRWKRSARNAVATW